MVDQIVKNQREIEKLLKQVYKEEKGGSLVEEKKPYLKEWKIEENLVKQRMAIKMQAVYMGKDPEVFALEQEEKLKKAHE